jgi:molecular chaperone DnaK (HSP70)
MTEARYSIGIDLGTTHCALAYVDAQASEGEQIVEAILPIPPAHGPG